jgi:hypothetical protein
MDALVECWDHVEEVWNKWGAVEVVLEYGGGLLSSPHRVYVFRVGNREIVCTWDGEFPVLDQYTPSYRRNRPPLENMS